MKYLAKINELFDSSTDFTLIEMRKSITSSFYTYFFFVEIKGHKYKFTFMLQNGHIYFDFYIDKWCEPGEEGCETINRNQYRHGSNINRGFDKYDFVLNDAMFIKVLNAILALIDKYVEVAIKDGKGDEPIKGLYYQVDEHRRERIYKAFFSKKMPTSEYVVEGGYMFFNLENPVPFKDFELLKN